jgi:hypothetical protein
MKAAGDSVPLQPGLAESTAAAALLQSVGPGGWPCSATPDEDDETAGGWPLWPVYFHAHLLGLLGSEGNAGSSSASSSSASSSSDSRGAHALRGAHGDPDAR